MLKIKQSELTHEMLCVCGHEYGWHSNKAEHKCLEESTSRPGHTCACVEFTLPQNAPAPVSNTLSRELLS